MLGGKKDCKRSATIKSHGRGEERKNEFPSNFLAEKKEQDLARNSANTFPLGQMQKKRGGKGRKKPFFTDHKMKGKKGRGEVTRAGAALAILGESALAEACVGKRKKKVKERKY